MSADQDHLPRRLWWLLAGLTFASVSVTVFSLSMLVIPVVGVISMLFLGERPSWAEYAALALVLGSLQLGGATASCAGIRRGSQL